jgi:hypothetical protein
MEMCAILFIESVDERVRQTLQMKSKRNKKKSKKVRMLGNDVTTWGDNHEAMRNLICLRS